MTNIIQTPAYRVAFSMYVALGGDKTKIFDSVEAIYAEIDKFYGKGSRITTEALIVNIGENGSELYNDDAITGYKPVRINVDVPQKYTDAQVEELKETSRQQGYDSGYDKGIADGYVQGESEGYTDGYAEGLEDGAEDQKALLEEITIIDNGVYEKEDGYNKVTVAVPIPEIPTFETEELSVELKSNGSYNYTPTTDGYSKVSVTVDVAGSGGGDTDKPKIYNGFRFTAGDMATVDFTQYDWSRVYDTLSFFEGTTHSTSDWSNFESGFNGKFYNCNRMFYNCSNLTLAPQLNTSNSISTSYMFYGCSNLTSVPYLDLSKSTDADRMFSGCSKLTGVSLSNTGKVTNMSYMFYNCSNLTTIPLLDASDVTNMEATFYGCSKLTGVSLSNTGKVTNMSYMFNGCSSLTLAPQLDTSNATKTTRMFYNCSNLTSVPHLDLSKATDIGELYYGCSKLTEVSLSNTSKVTVMNGLFRGCSNLTTIPQLDTSNVANMEYIFGNCSSLTTIPQLDYSKVTTITYAFYSCSNLIELPDFNTVKLTNFGGYSYNTWLGYCGKLQKLGAVNCDSVTNIDYFFGHQINNNLTEFGGCINLGAKSSVSNTNSTNFMNYAPNLNYQSVLNVLNGLYDRKTAGYSTLTLKLHANHKAMLSDDDIAIATNKGWIIS